jgi:hypothetical protein
VPHEPWIFRGTWKENIVFNLQYDDTYLQEVITACALTKDMADKTTGDSMNIDAKVRVSLLSRHFQN